MKVLINEIEVNNVLDSSTSYRIDAEITVEDATAVYTQVKDLRKCEVKYIDNENIVGVYSDKHIKSFSYELGIASFILSDIDTLSLQVQENTDVINMMLLSDLEWLVEDEIVEEDANV